MRVALRAGRCLKRGEALARWRRPDEVEPGQIRGREILERVRLDEGTAIVRLGAEIDAGHLESGLSPTPVPAPCLASASNVSPVSTRTAWLPVAASKQFMADLSAAGGTAAMMLRFLMPHEPSGRGSEIDRPSSTWKIPGERMMMNQDHVVPLTRRTITST